MKLLGGGGGDSQIACQKSKQGRKCAADVKSRQHFRTKTIGRIRYKFPEQSRTLDMDHP